MNFFATFINLFLTALSLAILARVIMSWVTMFAPDSPIVKTINDMLNQMTEPVLGPLRRVIPPLGMFDLTPMIALILLQVIQVYLVPALYPSLRQISVSVRPSTAISFVRDRSPEMMDTVRFGTPRRLATTSTTALFALSRSGAAIT